MDFWDNTPDLDLPEKEKRKKKKRPESPPDTVIYVRLKCPKCQSLHVPVQNTQPQMDGWIIRYHKCEDCDYTFKSVEKVEE